MKLARLLLIAASGRANADCVVGDIDEEFAAIAAARGPASAHRWYASQVIRSIVPLSALWLREGILRALCALSPLILIDRLWRFIYSQIPLKADPVRFTMPYLLTMAIIAAGCLYAMHRRTR